MGFNRFISVNAAVLLTTAGIAKAQVETNKAFFAPQRKQYLENVSHLPLLKQHKIDEIFRVRVQASDMVLDTPMDADREYDQHRANLEGISEPAIIVCRYVSQDLGQIHVEMTVDDYADPKEVGRLRIAAEPVLQNRPRDQEIETQRIEIEKIWQTMQGFRRMSFTQGNDGCRLSFFANDAVAGGFINETWSEKDFTTLRRNHRNETEKWLRPVFREIHQESAFAADPAIAWQVLAADWPTDDRLQKSMSDRIQALNSDDFRIRRAAANSLQKLGRDGALVMQKMDRRHLSIEQDIRVDEVVARFKPLSDDEARRLGQDKNFLFDCLYGEDAIARKLALGRLSILAGKPIDLDVNAADEPRIAAVNALRSKFFTSDTAPAAGKQK